jgi:4-hydroxybenzoate polyprenyltransferase
LDLATPSLAALLCLGVFPPLRVIALGLVTAFSGYTAVYALNDVVDYRADREKVRREGYRDGGGYLDALWIRHPMAQGLLSYAAGLLWTLGWGLVALLGAYLLNPACAAILVAGCLLEAAYCRLQTVSPWRVVLSGVVKTLGGMAAAYAVDPEPSPVFLLTLFLWIFFWEVGGQNVPHDWHDVNEDALGDAKTIPVRYGSKIASAIAFGSLTISVALCLVLLGLAPIRSSGLLVVVSLLLGIHYLIIPGYRLYRLQDRFHASALFNRASYYPLAILCAVALRLALG